MIAILASCGVLVCVSFMRRISETNDEIFYSRAVYLRKLLRPVYQRSLDAETEHYFRQLSILQEQWQRDCEAEDRRYAEDETAALDALYGKVEELP